MMMMMMMMHDDNSNNNDITERRKKDTPSDAPYMEIESQSRKQNRKQEIKQGRWIDGTADRHKGDRHTKEIL